MDLNSLRPHPALRGASGRFRIELVRGVLRSAHFSIERSWERRGTHHRTECALQLAFRPCEVDALVVPPEISRLLAD